MKFNIADDNTYDTLCEYIDSDNINEFIFIYKKASKTYSETELFELYDFLRENKNESTDASFIRLYDYICDNMINEYEDQNLM